MQRQQRLPSEIRSFIRGLENVHCVLEDPAGARDFYARIFGPPQHRDGTWSEFKIPGFDFAVTAGSPPQLVITFKVERIGELAALLEEEFSRAFPVQHGSYGDFLEVSPAEGFALHFFEAKKRDSR